MAAATRFSATPLVSGSSVCPANPGRYRIAALPAVPQDLGALSSELPESRQHLGGEQREIRREMVSRAGGRHHERRYAGIGKKAHLTDHLLRRPGQGVAVDQ